MPILSGSNSEAGGPEAREAEPGLTRFRFRAGFKIGQEFTSIPWAHVSKGNNDFGHRVVLGVEERRRYAEYRSEPFRRRKVWGVPPLLILVNSGAGGKGIDTRLNAKLPLRKPSTKARLLEALCHRGCVTHSAARFCLKQSGFAMLTTKVTSTIVAVGYAAK